MTAGIIIIITVGYVASFCYAMAAAQDELTVRRFWCAVGFSALSAFFLVMLICNGLKQKGIEPTTDRIVLISVPAVLLPLIAGVITGAVRRKKEKQRKREALKNMQQSAGTAPPPQPAVSPVRQTRNPPAGQPERPPAQTAAKPAQTGGMPAPKTYSNPDRATHIRMATNDLCAMCASGSLAQNRQWVRDVGQDLYDTHGFSAMQETYFNVSKRYPAGGSQLSALWDSVGDWAD